MGTESQLNVLKNEVVTHFFVNTADQDYILARMSHHGHMVNGFFWAAGQAIEKYLKASLLLNRKSSKLSRKHDLVKFFKAVNQYASDLFPERLTKPPQLKTEFFNGEETPVDFLKRIKLYTDPNSRYNIYGYCLSPGDLFYLDQFIFAARRVAFRLDARASRTARTVREMLSRLPKYQPRKDLLGEIITDSNHKFYDVVLHSNFPFAPDYYEQKQNKLIQIKTQIISSEGSSVLGRLIFGLLERPKSSINADLYIERADLADWVVKNIYLPEDVEKELCKASTCLRKRASASRSSNL